MDLIWRDITEISPISVSLIIERVFLFDPTHTDRDLKMHRLLMVQASRNNALRCENTVFIGLEPPFLEF